MGLTVLGMMENPVWMSSIELAVLVDHFWLNPKAKFHAQTMHLVNNACQTTWKLVQIDRPISQTSPLMVAVAKPAVIHDKELYSDRGSLAGKSQNLLFIKIKGHGLPVIKQNRALPLSPETSHQMLSIDIMEGLTHPIQALIAVH